MENGFGDLGLDLGLSREQLAGLRKWWREQRSQAAAEARAKAASLPEFIEDPLYPGA